MSGYPGDSVPVSPRPEPQREHQTSVYASKVPDDHPGVSMMVTAPPGDVYTPKRFTDDELYTAVKRLVNTHRKPRSDQLQQMITYVNRELPVAARAKQYPKATELEQASKLLYQYTQEQSEYAREQRKHQQMEQKLKRSEEKLRNANDNWNPRIQSVEREHAEKIQELEQLHQAEQRQFENDWSDPEYLIVFHKPSSTLLHFRDMEKAMGLAKDFSGAESAGKKAKLLEEQETANQRERAVAAMKAQYQNMMDRHARDRTCLLMKQREQLELLQRTRDRELLPYQHQIAKFKADLKENRDREAIDFAKRRPTRCIRNPSTLHSVKKREMLDFGGVNMKRPLSARN
jgi:hypothetical protein